MSPIGPDIGRTARAAVVVGRSGVVIAAFSRAVYLRFDRLHGSDVVALTTLDVPSGPLHIRVASLPELAPGDQVTSCRDALRTVSGSVELPASVWEPTPIADLVRHRTSAADLLRDVLQHRSSLDLSGNPSDVHAVVRAQGLRAGLASLAGRGAGLTPAGDDCAAGILLVTALLHGEGMPTWPPEDLAAAVAGHGSHDIAVAFLRAAAGGQSIEPIHALLAACVTGDRTEAQRQREVLAGIGRTSGLDLAYGTLVGLDLADPIAADREGLRERETKQSHSATYAVTIR